MILKKLHIENFGKLSDYDLDFTAGINSLCEKNGYGKSTITAFLKAMFYGLASYATNTKNFIDRMHYYPFDGAAFGGYVLFEWQGREYRIERTFAVKSEKDDTMTVYCNSAPTDELGSVPGVKIFGINKDSFENLLCVDSFSVRVSANDDINKKLNNYVDNVSEDFDITKVEKKLSDASKSAAKEIKELKSSIKQSETVITNLKNDHGSLLKKNALLAEAEKQQKQADKEYKNASEQQTLLEKWDRYYSLMQQREDTAKTLKELDGRYPNSLPTQQELDAIVQAHRDIQTAEGSLKTAAISQDEQNEYTLLKERYAGGVPTQVQLDGAHKKISDLDDIKRQLAKLDSTGVSDRQTELEQHFHGETVSGELIDSLAAETKKLGSLQNELAAVPSTITVTSNAQPVKVPVKKAPYIALLVIALVLVLAGVFTMTASTVLGVVLIVAGGLLIFADMFAYLVKSMNNYHTPNEQPQQISNPEHEAKKAELEACKNKLLMALANYRYNGDDPVSLYYQFSKDADEYTRLLDKSQQEKQQSVKLKTDSEKLQAELTGFFAQYGVQEVDNVKALDTIKSDITSLATLEKNIKSRTEQAQQLTDSIGKSKKIIAEFQAKFALPGELTVDKIKLDIHEHERLAKQLDECAKKAEKYKIENSLDQRPQSVQADMQQLKDTLDEKTQLLSSIRNQVRELEAKVDDLDSLELALADDKERLIALKEKQELYDTLRNEIKNADQRLKDRYVKPIKDRFCEYAKLIEEAVGQKVEMDKDYKISFDIAGKLRRYEHLSSGNLAVCALCFRLALLDNMFDTELPFIILDDPFVMLDKEHFEKTKQLFKRLSENKQIIYFCCHESRMI